MVQAAIQQNLYKFRNFMEFAIHFARRTFTLEAFIGPIVMMLKDYFTLLKKKKMAKYRVDYQVYRYRQMENLIAQNNQHLFITGQRINDIR